ncbi:hypothetical protein ECC02_011996 [Trypanosoma cruzi]|uniref:Uncharacterized protein n=1 Tax=Trypanosoma cruzi TaxID=5693 RepID=A0A7J6XM76_TRYCR|nr:hypothetical protein ECC02_011996 [Trypanosoma cruzi]
MHALFDSDDEVQGTVPTNPERRERGGGWQPPPSPWGTDPLGAKKNPRGRDGVANEGERVQTGASQPRQKQAHASLPTTSVFSVETHPVTAPFYNPTSVVDAVPQPPQQAETVTQQLPLQPPCLPPTSQVIVDAGGRMPEMPEMPEINFSLSPLRVRSPGNPPEVKCMPCPKCGSKKDHLKTSDDTVVWDAFLELRRKTEESVSRMSSFYDQVVKLQLTHEQEAASYRDASETMINQQRKALDALSFEYKDLQSTNENVKGLLAKKSQQLIEFENANYSLSMRLREAEQRVAHVNDRATVAEAGRMMAEIRIKELEASLEHATEMVRDLRRRLSESNREQECALQERYTVFEENRRDIIHYYDEREKDILRGFKDAVTNIQQVMIKKMKEREEQLSKFWQGVMEFEHQQQNEVLKQMKLLKEKEEKDNQANVLRIEQDKERWFDQYRNEMNLLEQRHNEREQHLLMDIARRERELGEREQRMRLQHAQEEQEAKVALASKEVELKTYYQKLTEDMRVSFDREREKLTTSFCEQIQELSHLHMNNERELERMHRDKEREMAQRYRIAGYEVDDRKGEVNLRGASLQAQSALFSKFDAIEARQRERAEKARAAFQTSAPTNASHLTSEKDKD